MSDSHTALQEIHDETTTAGAQPINPFMLFQRRNSTGGGFFRGPLIKLEHNTGEFFRTRGEDRTLVDPGEQFITNPHELTDTWTKFINGKIVERRVFRAIDGEMRGELGDNDESMWPTRNNRPKDPWQRQVFLPMKGSDDEVCAFSATGQSAIAEIGGLVGMYGSADRHGKFPVVELETRSFESQHGSTIYAPVFRLVGWEFWEPDAPAPAVVPVPLPPPPSPSPSAKPVAAITTRKADTSPGMDDEIPFVLAFFIVSAVAWLVAGSSTLIA